MGKCAKQVDTLILKKVYAPNNHTVWSRNWCKADQPYLQHVATCVNQASMVVNIILHINYLEISLMNVEGGEWECYLID